MLGARRSQASGSTRPFARTRPHFAQGGWVGLIVVLLALVVVAVLAKEALQRYGLVSRAPATTKVEAPGALLRSPRAGGVEALDLGAAPAAPASALETARGVEDMVKRQTDERAARGDGSTP